MTERRVNRSRYAALVALLVGAGTVCADTVDVFVFNFEFSINPSGAVVDPVISVGDTIRWVHVGGNHTTTSVLGIPEQWDAPITSSAPTSQHTFTHVGVWHYYCRPHGFDNGNQTAGGMAGIVTVLPAETGACCLPSGTCEVLLHATCLRQGGTFQGAGTICTPNPCPNQPISVQIVAEKDNILYQDPAGAISNALGRHLYVGNNNQGLRRRTVLRFDTSVIPADAVVQDASLRLFCNSSSGMAFPLTVHRLLASWGEGTSAAGGNEGSGAPASTGDATWLHRFFNNVFWSTPGGDFVTASSASQNIGATGFHTWTGSILHDDVQMWIGAPASNHGWLIRGDEMTGNNVKRFDSVQGNTAGNRPVLWVTYAPPAPPGACCLPDASCISVTEGQCIAQGGVFHGSGTLCSSVLCPIQLEPFVDALPRPAVAQPVVGQPGGSANYEIAMTEFTQKLHRDLPSTLVWGYGGTYPGPTIEANRDLPVTVMWTNDLRDLATGQLRTTHVLPIDTCLHGPNHTGQVPVTVVHLHGGHVPHESDGYPEFAFPPGQQSPVYIYPNHQPAATIWYHDHGMGITRLNVYMGLAGFYIIRDAEEAALNLPSGVHEIPLAIQDRSFNPNGSLQYPEMWMDHFHGDFILVNGKVWPYLEVNRGKYRFRTLNGSNSRTYTLALSNNATFWQIGSDTGLMAAPVAMTELTLAPGERADLIFDFGGYAPGTEIIMTNSAPTHFPGTPGVGVIPNVMKFIVGSGAGHTAPLPATLVPVPRIPEYAATQQRDFELKQFPNPCANHHDGIWLINGHEWHHITERPHLNTTEIWAWWNGSPVMHPMHMHLVSFQVLDRQEFDPVTNTPIGPRMPPGANEMGWKDTVQAPPSQITRVIARFERYVGPFPYHCHILEHEDHEMMRQFVTTCYANCDTSTTAPVLNVDDFTCFINQFALAQSLPHLQQIGHYANCDGSTIAPVLNVDDFTCFINEFATGCQ
jgi:FtsP/CotA-like multicopper oxidase with cupredoxin domain/plastocyanin